MKGVFSIILFFFITFSYGQEEANIWYFGHNAGIDFSTTPPTTVGDGKLSTFEGCSTISDKNGQLLFYSDGTTVWSKDHSVMQNGIGLLGNPSSTQSALVVPKPKDPNIYYLFTVGTNAGAGLNYYTIDISKNGGLGQVVSGPVDLSGPKKISWSEKVTAVEGTDCDTFWIISADNTNFYSYKIDINGVNSVPVTSLLSLNGSPMSNRRGFLKISPDGKHLALANQGRETTYLYSFNSTDGLITNQSPLNLSGHSGYGVEFSETSSKLYISTGVHSQNNNTPETANIYQFDLSFSNITDINNSREQISTETGFRGALQLGVDGRIYYARSRESHLGVINFPDKKGTEVQYISDGIKLDGASTSSEGLPPFIQSFFSPVKILDSETKSINLTLETHQVCIGDTFSFEPELIGATGSTYKWTKAGDPTVNISTRKISIDHANFGSGTYILEMIITDACGRLKKYNGTVEFLFVPKPSVTAIPVYEQCDIDSNPIDGITVFNLQSKEVLLSNNATDVTVDFFETTDHSFSSPIINKTNYINSTSTIPKNHKLIVRITSNASKCFEFGEIELKANPTALNTYPDLYLCEIDLNASNLNATNSEGFGSAFYNFDAKTTAIIASSGGAFSLATHTFEYYRTANDATLQTNQIVTPYDDDLFVNNSDVFVRISTTGTNACSGIGRFKVFVNILPIPQGNTNPIFLCVNNPIDNPQQITVDLNADTGITSDTYQWFLNGNLITGATNAIHKANVQGTYKVEAYRAYQNNITDLSDDSSCTGYNAFTVIESNKARIISTNLVDDKADPSENTLEITIEGIGNYEYAINSTIFVKGIENLKHTFTNIKPELNTVSIRDVNGCGTVNSKQLSFLFFQRHFSPNNDGIFDTWKIAGSNNNYYTSTRVEIFDRYGKVVALITDKNSQGWDGTFNGSKLPSNDYWFNAVLEDINGNIRKKTGHFSLIRK